MHLSRKRAALFATAAVLLPFLPDTSAVAQGAAGKALRHGALRSHGRQHGIVPVAATGGAHHRVPASRLPPLSPARGGTIQSIRVEGNDRIETGTILSYMLLQPGDSFDPDRIDRSLRTLYATGLFQDVSITRQANNTLVVRVVENPVVNSITFEGNHAVNDDTLRKELQLRPRAVFTQRMAQSDRQRLLNLYAAKGHYAATVEPQIVQLSQNRVNVIFKISEGRETYISHITFVGNHAFSEARLSEVISSRESRWWRFLSSSDEFNPQRVAYDRELLRRFYLKNGYADFDATGAVSELSPDRRSFFLTFTMHEGERYRVGKISVHPELPHLSADGLMDLVKLHSGDWYDGDAVEASTQALQDEVQKRGYPFVEVEPRIARHRETHTVDLMFNIVQGQRAYVERIDINGNSRTKDKVIRREFQFAEGDAFTPGAMRKTKQRLEDLGYFNSVNITTQPGSSPDKVIVNTGISEKATGELTLGGGFSTDAGVLGQVGLREKNLVGTGIDAGISGTLAQRENQIDLSVTDPYFLDRNLVAGADLYMITNNNLDVSNYEERRTGFTLRLGYQFNDHLSQSWNYSLVDRNVYNVQSEASLYVLDESGKSLLSQIGQTLTLDYRDSRLDPHSGFIARLGADFAGLGGDETYFRAKIDGSYYIPFGWLTGDSDWVLAISGGAGYLDHISGRERIVDRFFLGGDNLRGFQDGGAGPHSIPNATYPTADSLGGDFIYTQSTEMRFPLPFSADLGLSGRAFVDIGGLSGVRTSGITTGQGIIDSGAPRIGAGVGISWKSPFGLINVDIADPVVKKAHDQTQVFRFGFGTRF
jgi:outer membrane protein insertion porin family